MLCVYLWLGMWLVCVCCAVRFADACACVCDSVSVCVCVCVCAIVMYMCCLSFMCLMLGCICNRSGSSLSCDHPSGAILDLHNGRT